MGSTSRIVFITIIISQLVVLLVYLAVREHVFDNLVTRHGAMDNNADVKVNSTFQAANSTLLTAGTFSAVTEVLPKPTIRTKLMEDEGRKRNEGSADSSDDQTQLPVNQTTQGPSDDQTQLPVNQTTQGPSDDQTQLPVNQTTRVLPKQEYFQSVDGKEAWFYSAFYDYVAAGQGHPSVRLFGVVKNTFLVKVYCDFTLVDAKHLSTNGIVTTLAGNDQRGFRASYLVCPLHSNVRPTHVSISFQKKATPTNHLLVLYPGPRIRNFTVCFSTLHSNYNLTTQFIQSVEMNQILGAEHFMVYNYSVSPQLDKIMRRYVEDGILTINQWPLPTEDTHYYSQMAVLNDCIYRNRNTSRFVVVVDTDELIIPRNNNNWMELINSISPQEVDVSYFTNSSVPPKSRRSYNGCFMFKSTFFPKDYIPKWDSLPKQYNFDENEKKNILKYDIQVLSQHFRENHVFPPRVRTKYIARPELVLITGVHFVHTFVYGMKCLRVSEYLALIHHYKMLNLNRGITYDTTILKYKHLLYPRIMRQLERI